MPGRILQVSRRSFLQSSVGVAVFTAGSGTVVAQSDGVNETAAAGIVKISLRRPLDMISLEFEFRNAGTSPRRWYLRRLDKNLPIIAIVRFPSQHVDEEAFVETTANEPPGAVPVWSFASGESRLCFDIVPHQIALTPESLLDWSQWSLRLVEEVREPSVVLEPEDDLTAVELPTRLMISPSSASFWRHTLKPRAFNGRTEIWHTLLSSTADGRPSLRAVWSPDYRADPSEAPPDWEPVVSPLTARNRNGFVHASHVVGFDPEPMGAEIVALSSAGGWLRLNHRWTESVNRQGYPISWKQNTSVGRDSFSEVEHLAFLYPLGFKVSIVETTQRKTQDTESSGEIGFLRKHYTIKFLETERSFEDWRFPFSRMTPVTMDSPYLDPMVSIALPGNPNPHWEDGAFWPTVAGKPYEFDFLAVDRNGRTTNLSAPLLCVPLKNIPPGTLDPTLPAVQLAYRDDLNRSTRPYFGQTVGFTPELLPLGTSHPVHQIAFDGELKTTLPIDKIVSPFEPICTSVQLGLVTGNALGGSQPQNLAWFQPASPAITKTEIYLVADTSRGDAIELSFVGKSNKAGGVAAPSLAVGGFGRECGPFGQAKSSLLAAEQPSFASDTFDPLQYIGGDAQILGVSLSSILKTVVGEAARAAPQILSFIQRNVDGIPSLEQQFDWVTEELKDAPAIGPVSPIFLTQQESPGQVLDPEMPTRFSLNSSASMYLFEGLIPQLMSTGRVSNFSIQLAVDIGGEPNGVLLKLSEAWFRLQIGEKTMFGMDLQSADMIGPILSFVQQLQAALAPSLSHAARLIDVSAEGARVTLPPLVLPPITLGAMDIIDVRIESSASLPFTNAPPQFSFSFCSPDKPFTVAVGIFGGGGFLTIVLDTMGIQALSGMFQFGGFKAIELGVVRGRVFLFGGLFFSSRRLSDGRPGSELVLTAFVHAGGEASVFGIVTIGVDFYVSLKYRTGGGSNDLVGQVELSYSVRIGFFSRRATVRYNHVLQGSKSSTETVLLSNSEVSGLRGEREINPLRSFMTREDWFEYQQGFAL